MSTQWQFEALSPVQNLLFTGRQMSPFGTQALPVHTQTFSGLRAASAFPSTAITSKALIPATERRKPTADRPRINAERGCCIRFSSLGTFDTHSIIPHWSPGSAKFLENPYIWGWPKSVHLPYALPVPSAFQTCAYCFWGMWSVDRGEGLSSNVCPHSSKPITPISQ